MPKGGYEDINDSDLIKLLDHIVLMTICYQQKNRDVILTKIFYQLSQISRQLQGLYMSATKEEITAFLALEFPQTKCIVEAVDDNSSILSHDIGRDELRPGGTVSGPVLMSIADIALYVAILGKIGIVPLTVTTSLTINFLRKPAAEARIIAKCTLLKVGRTLIVGEVSLYSEGSSDLVAYVVGTYSIPPKHD